MTLSKTKIIGILTILSTIITAIIAYLSGNDVNITPIISSILAGLGLTKAADQ